LFFYWWTPLGMVLSLTGLVTGWVGWLNAVPRTRQRGLAIAGTILSAVAFILDLVVALLGLELIQLMPYR
jgi:mannose/fructose/N-acetylgalactosamine-specific phosphotransferase system component IIC